MTKATFLPFGLHAETFFAQCLDHLALFLKSLLIPGKLHRTNLATIIMNTSMKIVT